MSENAGRKDGPAVEPQRRRSRFATTEGKLCLCAVKDACSKRIVGYSIDGRMTAQLAVTALSNAVTVRGPSAMIVHSDRGSQFDHTSTTGTACHPASGLNGQSRNLCRQRRNGVLLQPSAEEVLNHRRRHTRAALRLAIVTWIETTYHRRRRQDALGRLTPIEFETLTNAAHAA